MGCFYQCLLVLVALFSVFKIAQKILSGISKNKESYSAKVLKNKY